MKIIVTDGYVENPGDLSWAPLEALGEVTYYDRIGLSDEDETIRRIGDAEIAVINKAPVSRRVIDSCPNLKFIAVMATGYNVVDVAYAKEKGIPVKVVTESKLSQLTGGAVHQGVAAEGACGTYVSLEELLERAAEKGEPPLLVLCDGIQDPHNLGAIIRTAEAAGAHGVVIPKRRSASLTLTVGKTSAGAASWLPVARVPNLASAMETLKKNGVWIYGTDAAGTSYTDADFTGGTAFVIGSEGFGMSRLVSEKCDAMLSLPMRGKVNSLNASVAAGIFMYEAVRQRLAK